MSSCEPTRTNTYSEDLRWRMIWQTEGLGYSLTRVAENLGVDKSTVFFYTTGSVAHAMYPKEKAYSELTTPAQMLILNLVLEKPKGETKPHRIGLFKSESELRALQSSMATADVDTLLQAAFAAITRADCQGRISQSGVCN